MLTKASTDKIVVVQGDGHNVRWERVWCLDKYLLLAKFKMAIYWTMATATRMVEWGDTAKHCLESFDDSCLLVGLRRLE